MSSPVTSPLKIVFAGTPEFAATHLKAILASHHQVVAVYTQPDRPAGRGKKLSASAVKQLALAHDLPLYQPASLRDQQAQDTLRGLACDLMVVVAYGLLLPQAVLDIPKSGCINVHGSILPRWRGAAPIQRAIEAGDTMSGVTIMQMNAGLDTGDMLVTRECAIHAQDSAGDLHDRLCEIGPPALLETLDLVAQQALAPKAQDDSLSNYAKKIEKHEAQINWHEPVALIERKIRAFNPFPICFTHFNGERLRVYRATPTNSERSLLPGQAIVKHHQLLVQCGDGQLALEQLQMPGKKAMSMEDFLNGFASVFDPARPVQMGEL